LGMENEHIRLIELSLGGELQSAISLGSTLIEHRHPFFEELRIIMRSRAVRLGTGADEDTEWFSSESEKGEVKSEKGEKQKVFHGEEGKDGFFYRRLTLTNADSFNFL
jgi:hypothetical protein